MRTVFVTTLLFIAAGLVYVITIGVLQRRGLPARQRANGPLRGGSCSLPWWGQLDAGVVEFNDQQVVLVGGRDEVVLDLNEHARQRLSAPTELVVVDAATHLFEQPGALDKWPASRRLFRTHLVARG